MTNQKIISFDLGTGGNKAVLYDADGNCLASAFVPYTTQYPQVGWHEQRPLDWWNAVVESTRTLLETHRVDKNDIVCIGISEHSLGAVPVDEDGSLLREETPIWLDIRAQKEAAEFFTRVDPEECYLTTGNGFPAACYTVFKVMWYQRHESQMWKNVYKILGTKDYINYRLPERSTPITRMLQAQGSMT
jgi:xylulokinase